jgi:hypothetical protein
MLSPTASRRTTVTPPAFVPGSAPGDYQLTPPAFAQPQLTNWAAVKPFALARADQFRPGPPPPVTSPEYAAALAEVRSVGELNSMSRTPDQTQIGQFWSAPIQNYWNQIAQTASLAHHDTLTQDARLFALLNMSLADDAIAFYDAKYTYTFWRPVTAVRADGIAADATLEPARQDAAGSVLPRSAQRHQLRQRHDPLADVRRPLRLRRHLAVAAGGNAPVLPFQRRC